MPGIKKNKEKKTGSFLPFLKFYTRFQIPWLILLASTFFSLAARELQVMIVPYTSKIMTGAITEGGFLIAFIMLNLANGFADTIQEGLIDLSAIKTNRNVNRSLWGRMLRLPMSYYSKEEAQGLVSRVTNDTSGAVGFLNCVLQLFTVLFSVYESFRRMYATYKTLSLIMLCGVPVIFLTGWIVGEMNYRIITIQNSAISRMTGFFAERLPGILHIKTNNMEEKEVERGIEENDRRYRQEVKAENLFIFTAPISSLGNYIFEVVLLIFASALVRSGEMKMFQLVNLYNYYILFMGNAMLLVGIWQGIKSSQGASQVTASLMDEKSEDLESGQAMPKGSENIYFEHVSFSYDGKRPILRDVSFTIPKGKKTALVGRNGSGKTTILRILERFEEPTGGEIRFGDKKLCELQLRGLRDRMGYLFQGNQIVAGSIRENIVYGIEHPCSQEEIIQAAKKANAYDFIMAKEEGFDAELGPFDNKVSGGEMQRIALARMILKQPDYLIMDEATSGIDRISEQLVMHSVDEMMEGKTVIMVSHNMDEIRTADHIVVLNEGYVEASGSFEEVYKNSELMQEFVLNAKADEME